MSIFRSLRRNRHLLLVLYVPVYLVMFFTIERLVPEGSECFVSYVFLDDYIPFVPQFVFAYILWYPFLVASGLLLVRDAARFRTYMYSLMLGFTLSLAVCLIFPNCQNLRPELGGREGASAFVLGIIYAADTNTNVFPSMHVVGCIAGVCAVRRSGAKRWAKAAVYASAALITVSTVLVKQHSLLDVAGGAVLGLPCCIIAQKLAALDYHGG